MPMLLRHYALGECIAARLETVGRECRAGGIDGLDRHSAAGERAQRCRAGYLFRHFVCF
jgi:hypothetical protein